MMAKQELILTNVSVLQFKESNILIEYHNKRLLNEINILLP